MTSRPLGLFDQEIRQRKLQALGDPLVSPGPSKPRANFIRTHSSAIMMGLL